MKTYWLATVACLMIATGAVAETRPGFEAGVETYDYAYSETYENDVILRDDGRFLALHVGYTKVWQGGTFFRARLGVGSGSVDYTADGGDTRLDDISQTIGDLQLHLGRDFTLGNGVTLSPFVGLGSRHLSDESGGLETSNGFGGYDREVGYVSMPFGISAQFATGARASVIVSAQYNWLVGGTAESFFSREDPEFPDVKVDLEDGSGFELSAMLATPIGTRRLSVGPYLRQWNIEESNTFTIEDREAGEAIVFFEPDNRTREVGLRLTFSF
jgi:Autotransporter beta-domain